MLLAKSPSLLCSIYSRLIPNHGSADYVEGADRRPVSGIRRGTSDVETVEIRESSEFPPMSEADYEHCYQEYYRYYYSHYYTHFSRSDNVESARESYLVAESARAAATAASAAVNAMRQSQLASKSRLASFNFDLHSMPAIILPNRNFLSTITQFQMKSQQLLLTNVYLRIFFHYVSVPCLHHLIFGELLTKWRSMSLAMGRNSKK